jgi:hypothetical protein
MKSLGDQSTMSCLLMIILATHGPTFLSQRYIYHDALEEFLIQIQSITTKKISKIRIDGAWKFKSQAVREQLKGMKLEMSAPYAYEKNGKAERAHRSLTSIARAMMVDSGLPEEFSAKALRIATYTRNRLPTKLYRGEIIDENDTTISPYEALMGTAPELGHMHPFGSAVYMFQPKGKQTKHMSALGSRETLMSESMRLIELRVKGLALDSELLRRVWALVELGLCLECSKV